MDSRRFDLLTRSIGASRSGRRLVLTAFGATLGLISGTGDELTGARRKHGHHKKCRTKTAAKTCAGAECGVVKNTCKKSVNCGDCPGGQSCNAGRCQPTCRPATCADQGRVCGSASDGCGNTLQCGECALGTDCESGACTGTCKVPGESCTAGGECCSATCGTVNLSNGKCCTPDNQVTADPTFCCIGDGSSYNQGAITYCGVLCANNTDCASHQPCIIDTCNQTTSKCEHTPRAGCCTSEAQCNDGNPCTVDTCVNNACVHSNLANNSPCVTAGRSCCQGICCSAGKHCESGSCLADDGCFVAGTRVAMEDGTSKPIELVAPGDRVLGRNGQTNTVRDVLRPVLGRRPLYGFDGGRAFVTAGHPFLTEEGWKAIDPLAARDETLGLAVGSLRVGDELLTLSGVAVAVGVGADELSGEIRLAPKAIRSIEANTADPATPLFNLRVSGNHSFFADELLVHNKPRQGHARA